jgi:hypothetical protein
MKPHKQIVKNNLPHAVVWSLLASHCIYAQVRIRYYLDPANFPSFRYTNNGGVPFNQQGTHYWVPHPPTICRMP